MREVDDEFSVLKGKGTTTRQEASARSDSLPSPHSLHLTSTG